MYTGMKRVTLTIVAVLLAVPALAHAKVGLEFDRNIEQQQPGESQTFSVMVMNEPADPMGGRPEAIAGVRPLVTFRNDATGQVIRVRASETDSEGIATGHATFPAAGPWSAMLSVAGHVLGGSDRFHGFTLAAPPAAKPAAAPPRRSASGSSGFPGWLLSFPAAAIFALGVWWLRRRPREIGA